MLHTSRSFDSTRRKAIADYEASNPISSEDAYRALRAVDRPPTAQILEADLSASIYAAEDLLLKVKGRDTSLEGGLRRERKILKRIADGLAWKFFDEHFLLVSARQQSPGFMAGKAGYQNERHLVELVSKLGLPQISLVLQNDITNVLRYTDITILGSNGAIISYEVKSSPRGLRGSRAKRQASRGDAILEYLESGASKKLFSEPLRTVEHHLERRYYWTQLDQVASAAVRMGSAW